MICVPKQMANPLPSFTQVVEAAQLPEDFAAAALALSSPGRSEPHDSPDQLLQRRTPMLATPPLSEHYYGYYPSPDQQRVVTPPQSQLPRIAFNQPVAHAPRVPILMQKNYLDPNLSSHMSPGRILLPHIYDESSLQLQPPAMQQIQRMQHLFATLHLPQQQTDEPHYMDLHQDSMRRRHLCKVCRRSFTTSGHLARHNRIHTGERKHLCPWASCDARFARQDNCMQHYKTHTNGKTKRTRIPRP